MHWKQASLLINTCHSDHYIVHYFIIQDELLKSVLILEFLFLEDEQEKGKAPKSRHVDDKAKTVTRRLIFCTTSYLIVIQCCKTSSQVIQSFTISTVLTC